jgi:hypothetical protein
MASSKSLVVQYLAYRALSLPRNYPEHAWQIRLIAKHPPVATTNLCSHLSSFARHFRLFVRGPQWWVLRSIGADGNNPKQGG